MILDTECLYGASQAWRVLTCVFTVQNMHTLMPSQSKAYTQTCAFSLSLHVYVCMHTRNLSVQNLHRLGPSLFSVQNIYIQTCAFIVQSLYTDLCMPYQSKARTQTCAFSVQNMLVDLCLLTLNPEHVCRLVPSQFRTCTQTQESTVQGMHSSN